MRKTYVILFKETLEIKTYTSLKGITEDNAKEDLGVSYRVLSNNVNLSIDRYENDKIRVELSLTRSPGEIRRNKQQFL